MAVTCGHLGVVAVVSGQRMSLGKIEVLECCYIFTRISRGSSIVWCSKQ